jgi:hypothetical protein
VNRLTSWQGGTNNRGRWRGAIEYARKPDTDYNGPANALRKHPEFKGISITRRGEKVFLTRKK